MPGSDMLDKTVDTRRCSAWCTEWHQASALPEQLGIRKIADEIKATFMIKRLSESPNVIVATPRQTRRIFNLSRAYYCHFSEHPGHARQNTALA
jgi:hypothetical protein